MNRPAENSGGNGFLLGAIVGGLVGAALAVAFAPRLAAELHQRATASANDLGDAAARGYRDVSARVAGMVDEVTARGQAIRDDAADAVGRGAREVEQYAMASKTVPEPRRS